MVCQYKFVQMRRENINVWTKKGIKGNRIDNIARQIVVALDDDDQEFGIGELTLTQCRPVNVPKGYTAVELAYEVDDFADDTRW